MQRDKESKKSVAVLVGVCVGCKSYSMGGLFHLYVTRADLSQCRQYFFTVMLIC